MALESHPFPQFPPWVLSSKKPCLHSAPPCSGPPSWLSTADRIKAKLSSIVFKALRLLSFLPTLHSAGLIHPGVGLYACFIAVPCGPSYISLPRIFECSYPYSHRLPFSKSSLSLETSANTTELCSCFIFTEGFFCSTMTSQDVSLILKNLCIDLFLERAEGGRERGGKIDV